MHLKQGPDGNSYYVVFDSYGGEVRRIDWHFFLLGGAFILIESKSITELALLFGSPWIVNVANPLDSGPFL